MSDSKYEQAVQKIFELTHNGNLAWSKTGVPASVADGTESQFPAFFEAEYQGRRLALFRERYYHTPPSSLAAKFGISGIVSDVIGADNAGWRERVVLVLLDDDGDIAYVFPSSRITRYLMDAVSHKHSEVDQFVDGLLSTEPTKA